MPKLIMRSFQLLHPIAILFLLSCTTTSSSRRAPASIENLPQIPAIGYLPAQPLAQFARQYNEMAGGPAFESSFYDQTLPFSSELQTHFAKVAAKAKKIMGAPGAPDPQLLIAKSFEANAFVTGVPACIQANVKILPARKSKGKAINLEQISFKPHPLSGVFNVEQYAGKCFRVEKEDVRTLAESLKNKEYIFFEQKCRFKDSSPDIEFECDWDGPPAFAREIVLSRALPFIIVHAGLIAAMKSYEELDAVLAHELGHYYLGHVFTLSRPRSYFYRAEDQTSAFRPPEEPAFASEGRRLLKIGNLREGRALPGYFNLPFEAEVLMHSMINFVVESRVSIARGEGHNKIDKACYNLGLEIFEKGLFRRAHQEYLYAAEITPKAQAEWIGKFEAIKSCLERVLPKKKDDGFLHYLTRQGTGKNLTDLIGDHQPTPSKNAWEAYRKLGPVIEKNLREIHASELLRQIGYYTPEEEADVFAIDFLRWDGRSQSDLQSALANMIRAGLAMNKRRGIDSEECLAAYENKWMLHGSPYRPLPVDFKDDHHDFCYRLRMLDDIYPRLGIYPETSENTERVSRDYQPLREKFMEIVSGLKQVAEAR